MITSSPQCYRAQKSQVMCRLGCRRAPCTPQVAASGKSSPTTTWSIQTALPPVTQLSQTVAALSWRRAPSMPSSSLMDAPTGDPASGAPAKEGASQTAVKGWARQTAVLPKGSLEGATCAGSVASLMPHPLIWADTSRHTVAWTVSRPGSVQPATSCTCPCQLWPCTCWPTTWSMSALYVARPSADPGSCRATWGLTLERNHLHVPTAAKHLPTVPTSVPTCRHTQPSSTILANAATKALHSSPTWTSTTSQPASRGTKQMTTAALRTDIIFISIERPIVWTSQRKVWYFTSQAGPMHAS